MADTSPPGTLLVPVHPLDTRRSKFAALSARLEPDLVIEIEPDVAMLDVRLAPQRSRAAAAVLGTTPPELGTWTSTPDGRAFRLGPDQWLLTGTDRNPTAWEASAIEALRPHGGTATDVSAQHAGVRLRGGLARELLARACSIDLRPRAFPAGSCARTLFGQIGVLLVAGTADPTGITVLTRTAFAGYLADRLLDAAEEFRPDTTDPPARRETP